MLSLFSRWDIAPPSPRNCSRTTLDVSWWVTPGAYKRVCAKLYAALRHWIERAFPFTKAYYSNTEIPELPEQPSGKPLV